MTDYEVCEACGEHVEKEDAEVGYKVVQNQGREYYHSECIEKIKERRELEYRERTEVEGESPE